ncbi:MAG: hypothetical protein WAU82_22260, partial [Candidatus Binatus sp.]|uniref:hypothetical protein n=1 Tax=Candidatus Binatus sp. TaxID=2811406 RepID=UPI003BAF487B
HWNRTARSVPHYLRRFIERVAWAADFNVTIHDLFDLHRRPSAKSELDPLTSITRATDESLIGGETTVT